MRILGPHPRPTKTETQGLAISNLTSPPSNSDIHSSLRITVQIYSFIIIPTVNCHLALTMSYLVYGNSLLICFLAFNIASSKHPSYYPQSVPSISQI